MVALVLSDTELIRRARRAGEAYRELFGFFPHKIGIHYRRLSRLDTRHITFLEMHRLPLVSAIEDFSEPIPAATRVQVPFEPVIGEDISTQEVYFPHPYYLDKVLSFPALEKLLAERGGK